MSLAIAAAVFPVIFLGELPDKTMFASLLLASRGRPAAVWCGAAGAFAVHVVIAVALGGALTLAPRRAVDGVVAALFLLGAALAWREAGHERDDAADEVSVVASGGRTVLTAFVVIFLAEWGDLTQVLTASLAGHYHSPVSVGVGALAALWVVAGLAVTASRLLGRLPAAPVRRVTAVVLLVLAVVAAVQAVRA